MLAGKMSQEKIRVKSFRSAVMAFALVAASIAVATVVIEVALRLVQGAGNESGIGRFTQYDPVLGWKHKENYSGEMMTAEYRIKLEFNAHGVRGADRAYAKPANVSRIVVIGDSCVDGYTVPTRDRLTEVMEQRLGTGVEVVNLGVAAYSTDQELLTLEREGWKYQPDAIVLVFTYRNVWQNDQRILVRNTHKPLFVLEPDGALKLTHVPVPYPTPSLEDRSKTYALVRTMISSHAWLSSPTGGPGRAVRPAPAGAAGSASHFLVFQTGEAPELKRGWSITQALLRKMKQESDERGVRLLVFYAPTRVEVSPKEWSASHIPENYDPRRMASQLAALCESEGISFIDPSARFQAAQQQKPLYFARDPHWNVAGHHLAGEILASSLADRIGAR
jgi:hypothetical protein